MMANRLFCSLRSGSFAVHSNIINLAKTNHYEMIINSQKMRHLYSKATLGIDNFKQQKERVQLQMENIGDRFRQKMGEYTQDDSKNMIFTEDLKNMIHLSQNDEDVGLVVAMMKKFNQQNKQLRFGNYVFGPVVMRLFHTLNKPDMAYECFKSPELEGFFDQFMSYQVLLDLLYENNKYNEILEITDIIKNKQIEGSQYPRNIVVLALAACYKLNSKESLDYALKLWQELKNVGHFPMRRATTFCAGLALNQGEPGIALEIITSARNQNYTTVRNLKVLALAEVGRVEDALPILKSVLNEDTPTRNIAHTFNPDVLERIEKIITKLENSELSLEFNRLQQLFQKQGHIADGTLDEQLCIEIQQPPIMNNRQDRPFNQRNNVANNERWPNRNSRYNQRPGLEDLV